MIPFLNLRAQWEAIKDEALPAAERVLASAQYVLGPEVAAFENEFAALCGVAHGIGVNTGTSSLHLALLAAGVGPGDEVITVPHTFVATVAAILYAGARPVFVDVEPGRMTMDPALVAQAVTPRTKALLPVHLYGQTADMDPLLALAQAHGLTVMEDACQAHGAAYKGRPAGSLGAMACFSFYPGKNLGACGEGGMVVTDDAALAEKLRMLRDWGAKKRYHHEVLGYNYRMDGIQGAMLRIKLKRLPAWNDTRRAHAALYGRCLAEAGVTIPWQAPDCRHAFHLYVVRHPKRDALQARLQEAGVQTGLHYPVPVHLQPGYAGLGYGPGDFPASEAAAREVLSLPMCPFLTPDQVCEVAGQVARITRELDA
jgi:dTDP-4-amino-4,6-dideoxygalactose transaminase